MIDVACFCGWLYSFEGGAGACPRCGEVATVRPEPPAKDPMPVKDPMPFQESTPVLSRR